MLTDRHILISGRWDNNISVVDLDAALTGMGAAAIVSRPRVTVDVESPSGPVPACGLPVSMAYSHALQRVAVVNHAGASARQDVGARPHGHRGSIAVLDATKLADSAGDDNLSALIAHIPVGTGPVGVILLPDQRHVLVSSSEGQGSEDGGCVLSLIDLAECRHVTDFELSHSGAPCVHDSPNPGFGRYPNPCGLAVTDAHGGVVLSANGGSADVSVIPLKNILDGRRRPETGRVRVSCGAFGIAINRPGNLAAVANREDPRSGRYGGSVTLIHVKGALEHPERAVIGEISVGARAESRPSGLAFDPSGTALFVACTDDGTVSRLDGVDDPANAIVSACVDLDGCGQAMPRGLCVTGDGAFVLVSGGRKMGRRSASLWILSSRNLEILTQIHGVGDESYFLFNRMREDTKNQKGGV